MPMATSARRLAAELGVLDRNVFFNEGWIDYRHRASVLLDADIGVSTHRDHIETAYAFRTRILDYVWTGLPIVSSAGDAFADLVERRGLGLVVDPGDVGALASALGRLLDDPALAEGCRRNVEALRPELEWARGPGPPAGLLRAASPGRRSAAPTGPTATCPAAERPPAGGARGPGGSAEAPSPPTATLRAAGSGADGCGGPSQCRLDALEDHVHGVVVEHILRPRSPASAAHVRSVATRRRSEASVAPSPKMAPPPERSQCQDTTSLPCRASTGVPTSQASITDREKLSIRLGCTSADAAASALSRSEVSRKPRSITRPRNSLGTSTSPAPTVTRSTPASSSARASEKRSTNQGHPLSTSRRPA